MRICVFEDTRVLDLAPLTLTRPVFDLRCGTGPLLERHQLVLRATETGVVVRPILAGLQAMIHPDLAVNDPAFFQDNRPVVLVNGRWLPDLEVALPPGSNYVGVIDEEPAYIVLGPGEAGPDVLYDLPALLRRWLEILPWHQAGGTLLAYPWELVEVNGSVLCQDAQRRRAANGVPYRTDGLTILGPPDEVLIHPDVEVEAQVLFDSRKGPVLVDAGARIQAFSRVEGPCHIAGGTELFAARLRGGSIGPGCRVGGEVEQAILHGWSNKYHDGFLGHSYVGEWVNIGAGTQFSDLRNDYHPVQVYVNGEMVETGLLKVGAFVGDHTRICINCAVNTGTVLGPFCQLASPGPLLPRVLPAFSRIDRGQVQERADLGRMFATAEIVLARRGQTWTQAHEDFFLALYEETADERGRLLQEGEQRRRRRMPLSP